MKANGFAIMTAITLLAAAGFSCGEDSASGTCRNDCASLGATQCAGTGYQTCGNYDADSCLEWSLVTSCNIGELCLANGKCGTSCTNDCATDARQCKDNGFQTCGNFDEDECSEWGDVTVCAEGETCSAGVCSTLCSHECAKNARQCNGNGFQLCDNFDQDECYEWGQVTPCAENETCSSGVCSSQCSNECAENANQCSGAGYQTCGNYDADDCIEWSQVVPCEAGETCSNGECSSTCANECALNSKQCATGGVQTCGNNDDDPCLEWGAASPCPQGQTCSLGECTATCADECVEGSKQCKANGYQACGNYDVDDCFEWSATVSCQPAQVCSSGECASNCADECAHGARRCAGAGYQTCGNYDEDNCSEWSNTVDCPPNKTCSSGECSDLCSDECAEGAKQCEGNGFEVCGNYDTDSCRDWSTVVSCNPGEACSGGVCAATCVNECAEGSRQCASSGYQECGNLDNDDCFEWSLVIPCAEGESCSNGTCASNCTDECDEGATRCAGSGISSCGNFDLDDCFDWGTSVACPEGQACSNGQCMMTCEDECENLEFQCASTADFIACGEYDFDACNDWSPPVRCGQGLVCKDGACVPVVSDCVVDADCAFGQICIDGKCLTSHQCAGDADCAAGETCVGGLCVRATASDIGGECAENADCDGGVCFSDPGGYCSQECDAVQCPVGATCYTSNSWQHYYCLADCATRADCRPDQACLPTGAYMGGTCITACAQDADCYDPLIPYTCDAQSGICEIQSQCDPVNGTGCPDNKVCYAATSDYTAGVCLEQCSAVLQNCSDGVSNCIALDEYEAICVPAGSGTEFTACGSTFECGKGLMCVTYDEEGNAACMTVCSVESGTPCTVDQACYSLGLGDTGVCL